MLTVGFIEGIAEATASITKVFSGALSDWLGKRKFLAVLGYGLAALTKPIFPLAGSVGWLVTARFIDRIGKGIRGAPRDALIADIAPAHLRGASFGLRQSLNTAGAFLGPTLTIGRMWLTANNFQAVFWVAVIPAFLAVGLLLFAVDEPERSPGLRKIRSPFSRAELGRLSPAYWRVVGIAVVLSIARFSEACAEAPCPARVCVLLPATAAHVPRSGLSYANSIPSVQTGLAFSRDPSLQRLRSTAGSRLKPGSYPAQRVDSFSSFTLALFPQSRREAIA